MGFRKKKSKDVELYRYWNVATRMIKFRDSIDLNSCWQAEGDSFRAVKGGHVDTATLGRFEHETATIPSLVSVDDHVIFSFAENSIVRIKDGLFIYQQSDVIGAEETLSVKKDKKMKRWAGLVAGAITLGSTASYLTSPAVVDGNDQST